MRGPVFTIAIDLVACCRTQFRDVSTILAVTAQHCSSEPFLDCQVGIRVQRISGVRGGAPHYRVLEKNFTGSGWKSQFGGAVLSNTDVSAKYIAWAELAAAEFGADICALDIMRTADGTETIIEFNDTACGFLDWEADTAHVVDLALDRMNELLVGV